MSDDSKILPDARTVLPGRVVSYHSQGRQTLTADEPVADGEQFNAFAELVKWRRWAAQSLGDDGFQGDADLRTRIAEGADADQLGELTAALRCVPPGAANGCGPAWMTRLHRAACDVAGIGVPDSSIVAVAPESTPPAPPGSWRDVQPNGAVDLAAGADEVPVCGRCHAELMYSARQRGDGLCGPCHRKAAGTQGLADRCRAAGIEPSLVLEILASPEGRAAIRLAIRDAEFFDAIPDDALRPGHTWRDPEGTEYVVVPAGDVGDRPRWLVGERTTPHHLSGLRTRGDLHMKTPVYHPYVLVEKPAAEEPSP
jgi:hypothetical protein